MKSGMLTAYLLHVLYLKRLYNSNKCKRMLL